MESKAKAGVLFIVGKHDPDLKHQLQISLPKPIADAFGVRNNSEVIVTKVDGERCNADYVEFYFQDQYLGRNDMWRLGRQLTGKCIYAGQEVTFVGSAAARIQHIYIGGKRVSSAIMTPSTKSVYRSLSAKVTIFITVCRELWYFAGDGERYNEKIVHACLPTLFNSWRAAGTNHTVTIVLICRVFYDQSEVDYAAGPLLRDDRGNWYKDFYKVITDLEVIHEWRPTLVTLKTSFYDFQRDVLLTHHYHMHANSTEPVRLVGKLSYAHDAPVLEALNLALNPTETHYIDRSLSNTGATSILITPGTGYFRVNKRLLRLTTMRILDQGHGFDLISLAKPPLHQTPMFSFLSADPEMKSDKADKDAYADPRSYDPLWVGEDTEDGSAKSTFWWEPFWISISFWDKQLDLPFRADRFVARAKMHEIQMLGLLEHDVTSSIEVPFLPENIMMDGYDKPLSKEAADQFDLDVFALSSIVPRTNPPTPQRSAPTTPTVEKRLSVRGSLLQPREPPIEESPRNANLELPDSGSIRGLSKSPSQSSTLSARSSGSRKSRATSKSSEHSGQGKGTLASRLAPTWLLNPFNRSGPSEPQTTTVSASASGTNLASSSSTSTKRDPEKRQSSTPERSARPVPLPSSSTVPTLSARVPIPTPFPTSSSNTDRLSSHSASSRRGTDDDTVAPGLSSFLRRSPMNTPPRDGAAALFRRRSTATVIGTSSSPSFSHIPRTNPSRPQTTISHSQYGLASRWQHVFPRPLLKTEIKWDSFVTPACLPLTVEYFPAAAEREQNYDMFSYDFVVDPTEMKSFLVKPPETKDIKLVGRAAEEEIRRRWALVVMRGMAAVRLAQGFQFILKPSRASALNDIQKPPSEDREKTASFRRHTTRTFVAEEDSVPRFTGASEILNTTTEPVYLSMSNEIHRISYTGDMIQVKRWVRRLPGAKPYEYRFLSWPKLGEGYTEMSTKFSSRGLESYGWNRLDMLVAGYEQQFNESLRYWRTRFIVIPTAEPPPENVGPQGELLNEEEMRILGIEKLAEQFTKLRWVPPDDKTVHPAVRFLPTTLNPAASVLDDSLMEQLDQIHAAGPLKKKMKSEREIGDMSLQAIAKAMREDDGVPIKHNRWHHSQYPNSFTGFDFVSWVVREFGDVSSRQQGAEWGVRMLEQGLFEHVRGSHKFLDGHYFYQLRGDFAVQMTPKGWFRTRIASDELRPRASGRSPATKRRKRLILSQSMPIDIDPQKKSDQAECVVLHHDIIHNPATVFHFELQWIGTTARCIEEQLRQWSRLIERYGLKLVEAYVTQISEVRDRNAFQSCFPLPLALPPPDIPDLEKRIPDGSSPTHYFEYALLRRFGFILDVEAGSLYPEGVDVVYSYRRAPFKYSQFVHRSGVAFVQVLGGKQGFLYLTNRLMMAGRIHSNLGSSVRAREKPAAEAEVLRKQMQEFCESEQALQQFYADEIAQLPSELEEPPPLAI
ncbi:hypothetical protein K525DRAFT_193828 [Schizophyllum commune Loenen D]|nr:hypothetical protein K525DRAFT_193828 [Schizophyllum commune Loenen D]